MLRLTRHPQQGIVIYPKDREDDPLVIRVTDIVPGTVGLGFEGKNYTIVRSEIYGTDRGVRKDDHS
tara:strand:- start:25 stop:222 length:198 start_codon:yes stop_codon:yes gene_type:complete